MNPEAVRGLVPQSELGDGSWTFHVVRKETGSMFFSEEKNQKTFMPCACRTIRGLAGYVERAEGTKSFFASRRAHSVYVQQAFHQPSRFKNAVAASGARALSPEMKYTKQSRPDFLARGAGPASFRSATILPAAQFLARAAHASRAAES